MHYFTPLFIKFLYSSANADKSTRERVAASVFSGPELSKNERYVELNIDDLRKTELFKPYFLNKKSIVVTPEAIKFHFVANSRKYGKSLVHNFRETMIPFYNAKNLITKRESSSSVVIDTDFTYSYRISMYGLRDTYNAIIELLSSKSPVRDRLKFNDISLPYGNEFFPHKGEGHKEGWALDLRYPLKNIKELSKDENSVLSHLSKIPVARALMITLVDDTPALNKLKIWAQSVSVGFPLFGSFESIDNIVASYGGRVSQDGGIYFPKENTDKWNADLIDRGEYVRSRIVSKMKGYKDCDIRMNFCFYSDEEDRILKHGDGHLNHMHINFEKE